MTSSSPRGAARGKPGLASPAGNGGKPPGAATARYGLVEHEIDERAIRLFADRGFAGTSLQDIADALGITRPALYYYVKSKDELLARLAADVAGGSAAQIAELAARPDLDAAGQFRPADARVAALAVIGMGNWVACWFDPGRDSAGAVAGQLADMALAAVQHAGQGTANGDGPAVALAMLRQDLDHLERLLDL